MKTRIILTAVCALLMSAVIVQAKGKEFPEKGEKVRNIFLKELDVDSGEATGKFVSLKRDILPKYKAVVFSFFSSTCIPCKKEMPALQAMIDEYDEEEVYLFFINAETMSNELTDEEVKRLKKFLADVDVSAPIFFDHYAMTSNKYGLKKGNTISLPATFIVGKDGTYKYAHGGFDEEETPKEWKAVLDKLTK